MPRKIDEKKTRKALRRLEEMEIRGEHKKLNEERDELVLLIGSTRRQWTKVSKELKAARDAFDPDSDLGRRRATFSDVKEVDLAAALEASKPKEPITVVLSKQGWIRGMKGHALDTDSVKFKDGDELYLLEEVMSTDKLILMSSDGRSFTLGADRLPGGRGHGEPVRVVIDMDNDADIVSAFKHQPGRHLLIASTLGNGFVVPEDDVIANTRKGKQVLNVKLPVEASVCVVADGDTHGAPLLELFHRVLGAGRHGAAGGKGGNG